MITYVLLTCDLFSFKVVHTVADLHPHYTRLMPSNTIGKAHSQLK